MQLIDTHVHINFDVFQADLEAVRERWKVNGISHLVHSCVEPEEFDSIAKLTEQFDELFGAIGLHPLSVERWWTTAHPELGEVSSPEESLWHRIMRVARTCPKLAAIGETGLDFYKASNRSEQEAAFRVQLRLARELGLPVIIHCRDAALEACQLLQQFWQENGSVPGVMHCWGGSPEETAWFLDLGFYISFSGIATFKGARTVQESVKMVPGDRLLIETDCPFLAPVPKRGKRNEPAYVRYVAEHVAQLRGVSVEAIAQQTTQNALKLFKIPSLREQV